MHFESSQFKRSNLYNCASADSVLIWWKIKSFTINCVKYDSILIRHEMSGFESCKLLAIIIILEQFGASGKSVTISIWERGDKMLVTWSPDPPDPSLAYYWPSPGPSMINIFQELYKQNSHWSLLTLAHFKYCLQSNKVCFVVLGESIWWFKTYKMVRSNTFVNNVHSGRRSFPYYKPFCVNW